MQFFRKKNKIAVCAILFVLAPYLSSLRVTDKPNESSLSFLLFHPTVNDCNYRSIEKADLDSIAIPLRKAGRIYLIEGEVDGEKGYLVFDTGTSGLVLNRTYFRNHISIDNANSNGVNGAIVNVDKVNVETLNIGGLHYKSLTADRTNLGHIENRRDIKILGLFGLSFLKEFEIIFNPGQNQLQLFRVNRKGERTNPLSVKMASDYTCPFELRNNILFLNIVSNKKTLRYCFDTGAETNVIDRYAPQSLLDKMTITRRSSLSGAGATKTEVLFGAMNNFEFGNKTLQNMETIITNLDALSDAYGVKINGILGYSFLSKGIICLNFAKKEFAISYLKTNVE